MNLLKLVATPPEKPVTFVRDFSGQVTHANLDDLPDCTSEPKKGAEPCPGVGERKMVGAEEWYVCNACGHKIAKVPEVVFTLKMAYLPDRRVQDLAQSSTVRKPVRTGNKKADRAKTTTTDHVALNMAICRDAVHGWDMTVGGARAIQAKLNLTGLPADQVIPFTTGHPSPAEDNLRALLENSQLKDLVLICLSDYGYWYPEEETQRKNSVSGPAGSSASPPAAPAGTPTSDGPRANDSSPTATLAGAAGQP